ncbi:glucose 1-dehydrogenase [Cribrihabitans marinus]|uniref:Glucose 1-dehydrogenase n=1 Tax=Cribrihabitans marinus TaxID=1227549 RepID=A0A1H7D8X7_9RHOB|nr:SDR family oxidoreductase [Cribrihabitans marinus]GGH38181.1 short-chain dehydrogenase/reductase SDR [Cribrihabitans marinus]SEJ98283.1 glucose 1-dehydrogenase [Cribrihabitans marinus]
MTTPGLLTDRVVLVTGAARGIGYAVAEAVLAQGGRVVLGDIDAPACREAAARLGGERAGAHALAFDVSAAAEVEAAHEKIAYRFGRLDGLVNNAAILDEGGVADTDPDRFEAVLSVNLTSMLRMTRAMLPLLRKSEDAAIVNTLSTQAFFGQPNTLAYAAAKGGAASVTRSMAVDLAPFGIRANGVAPGFVDTRMAVTSEGTHEHADPAFREFYLERRRIPLGRAGTAEDCAGAFVFLLSPLSAYVTGQVLCVDGGLSATY